MKKKKNLLFVFADQWRAGAMGYAGEDPVMTPNMDMFCRESTYCDHAFSTFPVCSPHRASMMTGKYPLSLGVFTNCKNGLSMRLRDGEVGIGQVLEGTRLPDRVYWQMAFRCSQNKITIQIRFLGRAIGMLFTPPGPRRTWI